MRVSSVASEVNLDPSNSTTLDYIMSVLEIGTRLNTCKLKPKANTTKRKIRKPDAMRQILKKSRKNMLPMEVESISLPANILP